MKQKEMPELVMAINPKTNKMVNVLPLFEITDEYSFTDVQRELDETIRLLVCSLPAETLQSFSTQIQTSCAVIYQLRDMFKKLQECEITIPNK